MIKQFKVVSIWLSVALLALFLHSSAARSQTSKSVSYTPSELQAEKLKVAQKDAIIAQLLYNQAQDGVNRTQAALDAEAATVKKENSWPSTVQFNKNTLTFFDAPEMKK